MPYICKRYKGKWGRFRKDTGELKSTHDTKEKCLAAIRAVYWSMGKRGEKHEGVTTTASIATLPKSFGYLRPFYVCNTCRVILDQPTCPVCKGKAVKISSLEDLGITVKELTDSFYDGLLTEDKKSLADLLKKMNWLIATIIGAGAFALKIKRDLSKVDLK